MIKKKTSLFRRFLNRKNTDTDSNTQNVDKENTNTENNTQSVSTQSTEKKRPEKDNQEKDNTEKYSTDKYSSDKQRKSTSSQDEKKKSNTDNENRSRNRNSEPASDARKPKKIFAKTSTEQDKSKSDSRYENKSDSRGDSKSETRSDSRGDSRGEKRSDGRSNRRSDGKSRYESKSGGRSDNRKDSRGENRGGSRSENPRAAQSLGQNTGQNPSQNPSQNQSQNSGQNPARKYDSEVSGKIYSQDVLDLFKNTTGPLTATAVLHVLGLKKRHREQIRSILRSLESKGELVFLQGKHVLASSLANATGRLEIYRNSIAFVIQEDSTTQDIFIPYRALNGAWHGDKVLVRLMKSGKSGGSRPEGVIEKVLERKIKELAVRVNRTDKKTILEAMDFHFAAVKFILPNEELTNLQNNDVLIVKLNEQIAENAWSVSIKRVLGPENLADTQENITKESYNTPTVFPEEVLHEASLLPAEPAEEDFQNRTDLQNTPFVTIDGETAKDFDDAIYVEKTKKGWNLFVAIADVAHYVKDQSELDIEAVKRANSWYFPRSVEPMLPEALSNGLCSLKPHVSRLAMVVKMEINGQGQVEKKEMFEAVIKSHARLTYSFVNTAFIEKTEPLSEDLTFLNNWIPDAVDLAHVLQKKRVARGSIDFDLPEIGFTFNDNDYVDSIYIQERNFAHKLIEEFMVVCNETVAESLEERVFPCMYRIHPKADETKLFALFQVINKSAKDLDKKKIPSEMNSKEIQKLLAEVLGTEQEFLVNRLVLRSMKQAKYTPFHEEHFGLGSYAYCHFTSPIRRYADLIVHRIIKQTLQKKPHYPELVYLEKTATHLNERERAAMEAEREIQKRLSILYMQKYEGEEYSAVISSFSASNMWVELDIAVEGIIPFTSLTDDYYSYFKEHQLLVGERTGKTYRMGQKIQVKLAHASLERLELGFTIAKGQKTEDYKKYVQQ